MNGPASDTPPDHVLDAFGAENRLEPARRAGRAWDNGWVYDGAIVLSPVRNSAQALWSAKVRDVLDAEGVRVAKSVRTSDGRLVIAGWQARHYISGDFASRPDETIVTAGRVEEALSTVPRPQFLLDKEPDYFTLCDRAAWDADPIGILERLLKPDSVPRADAAEALTISGDLLQYREEMVVSAERMQVCHADLVGELLYDGNAAPVLTDIVPAWHVRGWTAALAAVDCLSMMGADEELLRRFDHLPRFGQLLVRAMCFRLFVHAVSPESQPGAYRGLSRAASLVRAFVS